MSRLLLLLMRLNVSFVANGFQSPLVRIRASIYLLEQNRIEEIVERVIPISISSIRAGISFMNGVVANISTSSWRNA